MKNKTIYDGYKNEEQYRRKLISTIKKTEYEKLRDISRDLSFAVSPYDLIRIAEAYKTGDQELKDKIEYILEDINFHSENGLLISGKADEVIDINKKKIEELVINNITDIFKKAYLEFPKENGMLPANATALEDCSLIEIDYLIKEGILQKRNCEGLAFEFTDEYIKKIEHEQENNLEVKKENLFEIKREAEQIYYLIKEQENLEDAELNLFQKEIKKDIQQVLDKILERLWIEFEPFSFMEGETQIYTNKVTLAAEVGFITKKEIWNWFDERHSKGLNYLLYEMKNEQENGMEMD